MISSIRSGDNDRRITLLSPVWGLIYATIYGARRSIKSIKAPLYTEGTFCIYRNREKNRNYLVDLTPISFHENLSSSLETSFVASLFSELVLLQRGEDAPMHYQLLTSAFDVLTEENWKAVSVQYILRYLEFSGLSSGFDFCPVCARAYGEKEILGFSSALNVPCCSDCDTMSGKYILPPNARSYLSCSLRTTVENALAFEISDGMLTRLLRYLIRYASLALQTELKAVKSGLLNSIC